VRGSLNHFHRSTDPKPILVSIAGGLIVYLGFAVAFLGTVEGLIGVVLGGVVVTLRKWIVKAFTHQTIEEKLEEERVRASQVNEYLGRATTPTDPPSFSIGQIVRNEYFPEHTGIFTINNLLWLAEKVLDTHLFIIGQIGSGKTTLLHLLIDRIVGTTERKVFFINFKGDEETDRKVQSQLFKKYGRCPIITIDPEVQGRGYNPFKYGNGLAIHNRVMAIISIQDYDGTAGEHYAGEHKRCSLAICKADEGPPRSATELRRRLDEDWLTKAYPPKHPKHKEYMLLLEHEKGQFSPYRRFANKLANILDEFEGILTEDGYTFEEGSVIFSVPASMYPDTAKKFAEVLIEDLKHYMHPKSQRQKGDCQIIWDEFQAADNNSITGILSQSRQFHVGVVLATQDVNKLGSDLQQKVVTSDIATVIALRTDQSAEFVTKLAGTVERPVYTARISEGQTEPEGSVRNEWKSRIDPNELAQLPNGYCFLVKHRTIAKLKLDHIEEFPMPPNPPELPPVQPVPPAQPPEPPAPEPTYKKFN
jgi:hypothetical protein